MRKIKTDLKLSQKAQNHWNMIRKMKANIALFKLLKHPSSNIFMYLFNAPEELNTTHVFYASFIPNILINGRTSKLNSDFIQRTLIEIPWFSEGENIVTLQDQRVCIDQVHAASLKTCLLKSTERLLSMFKCIISPIRSKNFTQTLFSLSSFDNIIEFILLRFVLCNSKENLSPWFIINTFLKIQYELKACALIKWFHIYSIILVQKKILLVWNTFNPCSNHGTHCLSNELTTLFIDLWITYIKQFEQTFKDKNVFEIASIIITDDNNKEILTEKQITKNNIKLMSWRKVINMLPRYDYIVVMETFNTMSLVTNSLNKEILSDRMYRQTYLFNNNLCDLNNYSEIVLNHTD